MTQINDDTWKESRFCYTEEKSNQVKLILGVDEACKYREDAPGDHDSSNPAASGPFFYQNTSGDLEYDVTDKEDSRSKSYDLISKSETRLHTTRRCKSNIHSIQVGNDVEYEQVRHQPARNTSPASDGNFLIGRDRRNHLMIMN